MAGPDGPRFLKLRRPKGQALCAAIARARVTKTREGTPRGFSTGRGDYVQGEEGSVARYTPISSHSTRRSNCSAASNSAFMAAAHSSSSDFKISGTFLFFRFSFTAGGEIPGSVVSGAQGFTGTLGTSVNFEPTTGETPAKSSVASSPSKPKQDRRPGVEVEAEPTVSRRL